MSLELLPHNQEAYNNAKEMYENTNRVAVLNPTGTGKSFIALKIMDDNSDKKIVYLSPSIPILNQIKKNMIENNIKCPKLKRVTYQKLTRLAKSDEIENDIEFIILDEFQVCGAPEYGAAVKQLLESNPNAKVLGLSATPIRYFDEEIRDMAEELFDDNIASEMTLVEAIAKGVLKEPKYVTGLYEYQEITNELEENIKEEPDSEIKSLAQKEIDYLKQILEEAVQGLPELLENNMSNKEGRYIVFCKNLEDLQKKMEKAHEMFSKVNPNIEIMSVSSRDEDILQNSRTIRKFETDSNDGKLKLLFCVNMLNLGYHNEKIDGVIMMRPTHSPVLYDQQLGRGMAASNKQQPLIIDLVNNIDTIEIVHNFAKKLIEAKRNVGTRESKETEDSKYSFSISEVERNARDIINKINKLLQREKRTTVSYETKYQIMSEYIRETGEEIRYDTVYNGYKIGNWRANLRAAYKNNSLKIDEELLNKFIELGIIKKEAERRKKTSDQEKYEFLMELSSLSYRERPETEKEYGMSYSAIRNSLQHKYNVNGKLDLSQEQIEDLIKKGFLNPNKTYIDEKMEKFGFTIPEDVVVEIDALFGSKEEFIKQYKQEEYPLPSYQMFEAFRGITISSKKITEFQKKCYADIISELKIVGFERDYFINIDELEHYISQQAPDIQLIYLEKFFYNKSFKDIDQELEWGRLASYKLNHNLRKLYKEIKGKNIIIYRKEDIEQKIDELDKELEDVDSKKQELERIKNDIIGVPETHTYISINENLNENLDLSEDAPIENLGLSVRPYNVLTRCGIYTIKELESKSDVELKKMRNMGNKAFKEIKEKLKEAKEAGKTLPYKANEKAVINVNQDLEYSLSYKYGRQTNIPKDLAIFEIDTELVDTNKYNVLFEKNKLKRKLAAYERAKQQYLENEDILNPGGIVKPVLNDETTIQHDDLLVIHEIDEEIENKHQKREKLDEKIEEVDRDVQEIIDESGINIDSNDEDKNDYCMIENLNLSISTYYRLKRYGIGSVEELIELTEQELNYKSRIGRKGLAEIKEELKTLGLTLKNNNGEDEKQDQYSKYSKIFLKVLNSGRRDLALKVKDKIERVRLIEAIKKELDAKIHELEEVKENYYNEFNEKETKEIDGEENNRQDGINTTSDGEMDKTEYINTIIMKQELITMLEAQIREENDKKEKNNEAK